MEVDWPLSGVRSLRSRWLQRSKILQFPDHLCCSLHMAFQRWFPSALAVFSLFVMNVALAASIQSFEYRTSSGQVSHVAIKHQNVVLVLDDGGGLRSIQVLGSEEEAADFSFSRPPNPQLEKIALSCHGGKANKTFLYGKNIADVRVLKYYRRAYDKTNGCYNAIASVRDISLDYYRDTPANRRAGIVGRLQKLGDLTIKYYVGTSKADLGKISAINELRFLYEPRSHAAEGANYIGKYAKIGDVPLSYMESTSVNKMNRAVGKIKQIGSLRFIYLSKFTIPNPPDSMMGHFSHVEGTERRFKVLMPLPEE